METTPNGWTLIDRNAAVLTYEYSFNKSGKANTWAARMADGTLVVLSPAMGMPEAAFDDLLLFGNVSAIVATNGFHHLGVAQWRTRFPDARVFAPAKAAARIKKKNPAAGEFESLEGLNSRLSPNIGILDFDGTKCGEVAAWAKTESGYVWFASDLLSNFQTLPNNPIVRLVFKLSKSGSGYRVFNLAVKFIIKDRKGVMIRFLDTLRERPPTTVVPAHGATVSGDGVADQTFGVVSAAL